MAQADVALQERLKRVMGEISGSTERRVFVGGMPFSYEVSDFSPSPGKLDTSKP